MYAYLIGSISPKSFYFEATFLTLAMLILGGACSVSGAVIGAIVVKVGFEIMRYFESAPEVLGLQLPQIFGLTGFFLSGTIMRFMALRPDGLIGNAELDEVVERYLGRRRARSEGSGRRS